MSEMENAVTVKNLSASLDTPVKRIPNQKIDGVFKSYTDGTTIYLAEIYVKRIGDTVARAKRVIPPKSDCFQRAQAIYLLLHEHGHVVQHRSNKPNYPGFENEANEHAAAFFRNYCKSKLKIAPNDVSQLWRALPEYYRQPTTTK